MNKIFNFLTGDIFKKATDLVDDLVTSKEEKLQLRNKLQQMFIDEAKKTEEIQASIINNEAKGNFLQRSWRPILMLSFGFIVMYSKFIAPAFSLPNTILEPDFWSLLNLGIGGYVIGRSAEQITKSVTTNLKSRK